MDASPEQLLAGVRDAELRRRLDRLAHAATPAAVTETREQLLSVLGSAPLAQWLRGAVDLANAGAIAHAVDLLRRTLARWPGAVEAVHTLAELLWRSGDTVGAERVLLDSGLSAEHPHLAMQLARMRRNQGRFDGAAEALTAARGAAWSDNALVDALQFLKQCQREEAALEWCEAALAAGRRDPRLYATAGNLAMALGRFDLARQHLLEALNHPIDLNTWYLPQALANCQRYDRADHPDTQRFARIATLPGLDARARASLLFAQAKLKEDSGELAQAAAAYRSANALLRQLQPFVRETWLRQARERRERRWAPAADAAMPQDFRPLFVVGLPRTGTTLAAERLARLAGVKPRGEPPLLEYIDRQLGQLGGAADDAALAQAAQLYATQMRQDDAPARWYLDKNPLNYRFLDLAARLFPQARVVWCRRAPRDTALSIWTQFFAHADYAFANDFADIRSVHDEATAALAHAQATLPLPLLVLDYERLVADTAGVDAELARFLDLEPAQGDASARHAIGSASLWQARQPVYDHAVGRAERFAALLPELSAAFPPA